MTSHLRNAPGAVLLSLLLLGPTACSNAFGGEDTATFDLTCSIPRSQIQSGGPGKDGIPALTDPLTVRAGEPGSEYLGPGDRVVGIVLDSQPLALPLNILWWHEIVNLNGASRAIAVTHCPLTGSTLAFDRGAAGDAEFGVSGLLFRNNLIMYDRRTEESLWPQMVRGARCGPSNGVDLDMVPIVEMTWEGWRSLYPDTRVISETTGFSRDYRSYPYGSYDEPDNASLLFPGNIDPRRPPKERVLGVPDGDGGITFPFGLLAEMGPVAALRTEIRGETRVVLWDGTRDAAMAYETTLGDLELSFAARDGRIVDEQTGSTWSVGGLALEGPLQGQRLSAVPEAFVAYWFAWPEFYPEVVIWTGP
jgi:hypothetical protein